MPSEKKKNQIIPEENNHKLRNWGILKDNWLLGLFSRSIS